MNDLNKTFFAILVAAALVGAVYLTRPAPITDARFSDQGETFFPEFADPTAARSLQVLAYDEAAATIHPFKVEFDGTRWVIPSHHNYPADAQANLAKAASTFIGLTKEQVVSDRAADFESLGVLAPDDSAAPLAGRGTRVTLTGEGGSVLADMIIGNKVKDAPQPDSSGNGAAPSERRYVRLPDKNRVYAANFTKTFSTSFGDWVETDLLQLQGQHVQKIIVDRYEIDETQGVKKPIEKLTLARTAQADPMNPNPTGAWSVDAQPGGPPNPGETANTMKIEEAMSALRELKIAGVRPKPPKLADWFAGRSDKVTQLDLLDLQSRGFFVTQQGQFVANEGEVSCACDDGVVYTLYFGEVLIGQGEALSAGKDVIASTGTEAGPEAPKKGQEARYAFVRVGFDDSLIPTPAAPPISGRPSEQPPPVQVLPAPGGAEQDDQQQAPPNEDPRPNADEENRMPPAAPAPVQAPAETMAPNAPPASLSAAPPSPAQQEFERRLAARKTKVDEGRKRADALSKRFADWYYVIDAASFAKLRPTRADVVTVAPPAEQPPQ